MHVATLDPLQIDAVARLWLESFEEHHAMAPEYYRASTPELGKLLKSRLTSLVGSSTKLCLVAMDEAAVIGFAIIQLNADHYFDSAIKRVAEIEELFVTLASRRKGVAARLIANAESIASNSGAQAIKLQVSVANHNALSFYENASYQEAQKVMLKVFPDNVGLKAKAKT